MRIAIIIILCAIQINVAAQKKECPPGYSWMPTVEWDYHTWVADKCLPDSMCKQIWKDISRAMCTGSGFYTTNYTHSYGSGGRWVGDSCIYFEEYKKLVSGKWIDISKCLYYWEVGDATECSTYVNDKIQIVPCCGHVHKTKPE